EELQHMRDLINENQQLRSDLAVAQARIIELENSQAGVPPTDRPTNPMDMDGIARHEEILTTTSESASDNTAYTVIYMPSPRRTLHSEIRRALRLLRAAQERVIDIHFPAHSVVGLLIHSSYERELRELLTQAKLTPKDNFNPIAASTIGDPTLLRDMTETEHEKEAKTLYQERMLT
ncbi:hypothetical protein BDB00DRAFT_745070, partial [Zychaea mexicana]|uniref:uncharacterized protein n=1 Tax=Zychaea mexicana TaxID=64656 RepID=UPI0022FE9EE7